ncbi:MAG: hypothetical protein AABX16_03100, partial [Nanoarchaeota archaeon]
TTNAYNQQNPAIYGDKIVWQDGRNGNYDIYLYDLSTNTERQITSDPSYQFYPAIYEDKIVWEDDRNNKNEKDNIYDLDIYLYDLSTNTERRITTNAYNQQNPAIYGDKIVWSDYRNGNDDIYLYDLSTNTEKRITTNAYNQQNPDIYGDKIVWDDNRNIIEDIYLYDLSGTSPICGNNKKEGGEQCDGTDSVSCPGQCTAQCTCPPITKPQCSDGIDNDGDRLIDSLDKGCWTDVNDPLSYDPKDNDESNEIIVTQSKIINDYRTAVQGLLLVKLQKKNNGAWQDVSAVANQQVSIPAKGFLQLTDGKDNLGNQVFTGFNTLNVKTDSAGDYRVYARFEKSGQFFESSWEFAVV